MGKERVRISKWGGLFGAASLSGYLRGFPLVGSELLGLSLLAWSGVWLTSLTVVGSLHEAHEEGGALELTQSALLGTAVVVAVVATLRMKTREAKAWGGLLAILALSAYAREADFHTVLNPRYLGEWGIRYRADWWLNGGVPVWVKLGWVVGLSLPVVVGVMLYRASGVDALVALRKRTPFVRLGMWCAGLYVVGYAMDDLFGRGQFLPTWLTMVVEEGSELGAAGVMLLMCLPMLAGERVRRG